MGADPAFWCVLHLQLYFHCVVSGVGLGSGWSRCTCNRVFVLSEEDSSSRRQESVLVGTTLQRWLEPWARHISWRRCLWKFNVECWYYYDFGGGSSVVWRWRCGKARGMAPGHVTGSPSFLRAHVLICVVYFIEVDCINCLVVIFIGNKMGSSLKCPVGN